MFKDFKGFKKIGGDAKHTVMRHDKGHEIKIAHSALSPKMRAKLAELPHADPKHADKTAPIKLNEGGMPGYHKDEYGNLVKGDSPSQAGQAISDSFNARTKGRKTIREQESGNSYAKGGQIPGGPGSPYMDKEAAKSISQGVKMSGADAQRWADNLRKAFAEQGSKKKMFGGGRVQEPKEEKKEQKEDKAPVSQETWDKFRKGFKQGLFDGAIVEPAPEAAPAPEASAVQAAAPQAPAPQAPAGSPIIINIPSPQQAAQQFMPPQQQAPQQTAPQAQQMAPEQQAPQMQPSAPQAAQMAPMAPQSAPDPYGINQMTDTAISGMQMEEQGIKGEAAAQVLAAKKEADIYAKQAETQAIDRAKFLSDYGALETEYNNVLKDYKDGYINPDQWWESKDTGGKIMTVIGLMLGGFAGGALHTDNPALAVMNKEIDRNIEAQKAKLGKQANLLSVYKEKFGNLKDAEQMVRLLNEGYYVSLMQEQAAKSKDPLVKARAMQIEGAYKQKKAGELQQMVQRQRMLSSFKDGSVSPEKLVPFLVDKHLEKDALNEISVLRGIDRGIKEVNKLYDDAALIGGIKGNLPFSDDKVKLASLNSGIIGIIRASMKGQGALSDQEVADSVTPNLVNATDTPTQVNIKRAELLRFINSKRAGAAPTLVAKDIPTTFEAPREIKHLPPKL